MSIVERMRAQLKESMKARDAVRTQFLRYWIAQFTRGDGTEVTDDEAMKKMRAVLKEASGGPTSFSEAEILLIRDWLPANLTPGQIQAALEPVADQIQAAPEEGMAMGIAMKTLAGQNVDSEDVRSAVSQIRS